MQEEKTHVCDTCNRELEPHNDPAVYIGWGTRDDGMPGARTVTVLCGPTPEQVEAGVDSSCVQLCRQWASEHNITLVPCDYSDWAKGESLRNTIVEDLRGFSEEKETSE